MRTYFFYVILTWAWKIKVKKKKNICRSYSHTSMTNKPIRYENTDRPSCIDLV